MADRARCGLQNSADVPAMHPASWPPAATGLRPVVASRVTRAPNMACPTRSTVAPTIDTCPANSCRPRTPGAGATAPCWCRWWRRQDRTSWTARPAGWRWRTPPQRSPASMASKGPLSSWAWSRPARWPWKWAWSSFKPSPAPWRCPALRLCIAWPARSVLAGAPAGLQPCR